MAESDIFDEDQENGIYASTEAALEAAAYWLSEDEERPEEFVSLRHGRSEFICVLIWKSSAQEHLGIHFKSYSDESFRISAIDEESTLQRSPLQIGDHVVSINDVGCSGSEYHEALRRLNQHTGAVTMIVKNIGGNPRFVTTFISKPSPTADLGVEFKKINGRLHIAPLNSQRFLADTQPCQMVLTINGVDCSGLSPSDALELFRASRNGVTINTSSVPSRNRVTINTSSVARQNPDRAIRVSEQVPTSVPARGRAELINAVAWKSTAETQLGLRFQSLKDGSFVISEIHSGSLFGNSDLRSGDHVISINAVSCFGTGYRTALSQIRSIVAPVTILARNPGGASGRVSVTIIKPSPTIRVGVYFKTVKGKLYVDFCEKPVLNSGDRILSINDTDYTQKSAGEAAEFVRAQSAVFIIASRTPIQASSSPVEVPAVVIPKRTRPKAEREISFFGSLPFARSAREVNEGLLFQQDDSTSFGQIKIPGGRARLTSVTAWKKNSATALGLKFLSYRDGSFQISGIDPTGLFAKSPLRVGDHVASVNDMSCSGHGYREALHLARLVCGTVTIVVHSEEGDPSFMTASFLKSTATQVGIGFKNVNGRLCIASSAAAPILNADALVLSINGIDCRTVREADAVEMIKNAIQLVTIQVQKSHRIPTDEVFHPLPEAEAEPSLTSGEHVPCVQTLVAIDDVSDNLAAEDVPSLNQVTCTRAEFLSAMVWKFTQDKLLGIHFQRHSDGFYRISAIQQNGLFAESALGIGDRVISINQISCQGKGFEEALSRLRTTSGAVTVVVQNMGGSSAIVTCSVTKPTSLTPLGISFQKVNNRLCVATVQSEGICCGSLLSPGQKIISINGLDCRFLGSKDAVGLVKNIPQTITFVAEVLADSAIVVASS
jgi:C-terminal processing protease CtpA/Prc